MDNTELIEHEYDELISNGYTHHKAINSLIEHNKDVPARKIFEIIGKHNTEPKLTANTNDVIRPKKIYSNRDKRYGCQTNDEGFTVDPFTMEEIPEEDLVSYSDGKFKYCFNINTLTEYWVRSNQNHSIVLNPYNRSEFPSDVIKEIGRYEVLLRRKVRIEHLERSFYAFESVFDVILEAMRVKKGSMLDNIVIYDVVLDHDYSLYDYELNDLFENVINSGVPNLSFKIFNSDEDKEDKLIKLFNHVKDLRKNNSVTESIYLKLGAYLAAVPFVLVPGGIDYKVDPNQSLGEVLIHLYMALGPRSLNDVIFVDSFHRQLHKLNLHKKVTEVIPGEEIFFIDNTNNIEVSPFLFRHIHTIEEFTFLADNSYGEFDYCYLISTAILNESEELTHYFVTEYPEEVNWDRIVNIMARDEYNKDSVAIIETLEKYEQNILDPDVLAVELLHNNKMEALLYLVQNFKLDYILIMRDLARAKEVYILLYILEHFDEGNFDYKDLANILVKNPNQAIVLIHILRHHEISNIRNLLSESIINRNTEVSFYILENFTFDSYKGILSLAVFCSRMDVLKFTFENFTVEELGIKENSLCVELVKEAINNNDLEALEYLLEKCDVYITSPGYRKLVLYASEYKVAKYTLDYVLIYCSKANNDMLLVEKLAFKDLTYTLRYLLEHLYYDDKNVYNNIAKQAVKGNRSVTLDYILNTYHSNVTNYEELLLLAEKKDYKDIVKFLLNDYKEYFNFNYYDAILKLLIKKNNYEMIVLLLSYDINLKNLTKLIDYANVLGHKEIADYLSA